MSTQEVAAQVRAAFENLGETLSNAIINLTPTGAEYDPWGGENTTPEAEPTSTPATAEPKPEPATEPIDTTIDETPDIAAIREILARLAAQGESEKIKQALTQLGASKLSNLPVEKHAQLLHLLEIGK